MIMVIATFMRTFTEIICALAWCIVAEQIISFILANNTYYRVRQLVYEVQRLVYEIKSFFNEIIAGGAGPAWHTS